MTTSQPIYAKGMREHTPDLCWWLLNDGKDCCILDRGHDNGQHEQGSQLPPEFAYWSPEQMLNYLQLEHPAPTANEAGVNKADLDTLEAGFREFSRLAVYPPVCMMTHRDPGDPALIDAYNISAVDPLRIAVVQILRREGRLTVGDNVSPRPERNTRTR